MSNIAVPAAPDSFVCPPDDPLATEQGILTAMLVEYVTSDWGGRNALSLSEYKSVRKVPKADSAARGRLAAAAIVRVVRLGETTLRMRSTSSDPQYPLKDEQWAARWESLWMELAMLGFVLEEGLLKRLLSGDTAVPPASAIAFVQLYLQNQPQELHSLEPLVWCLDLVIRQEGRTPQYVSLVSEVLNIQKQRRCLVKGEDALIARLEMLVRGSVRNPLARGEAWSDAALDEITEAAPAQQEVWADLLTACREAKDGSPSAKWINAIRPLMEKAGVPALRQSLPRWFALTNSRRTVSTISEGEWRRRSIEEAVYRSDNHERLFAGPTWARAYDRLASCKKAAVESGDPWTWWHNFAQQPVALAAWNGSPPELTLPAEPPPCDPIEDHLLLDYHQDILRGLAWVAGLLTGSDMARALTTLALSAYRKVPGKGPRAVRVGNACITGLSMMGGLDAVGQLAVLKVKVKFGTAQIQIEKALTACAAKSGVPRDELEEMSVPAYGLTEVGRCVEPLGEYSAELLIHGTHDVALVWRGPDGKEKKSLPAAVKTEFKEELKELTAAKKDIERMLPAQAERIDALFLAQKSWPLEFWLEHYLQHPLVGVLTRCLIWNFTTSGVTTAGIRLNDTLTDRTGTPVRLDAAQTRVSLWHPLGQPADEVLAWRNFLEEHQIRQPFKQAWRELYILTPAEAETVVYSNRFAAHILRQHQFNALCGARGWRNKLRLIYDNDYPAASRTLPGWNLRAEFWIENAGEETNDSGVCLHIATDQVRFYPADSIPAQAHAYGGGYAGGGEPLRLADIPPLVFSEIMRDVDLFVGVASVGNDPNWRDGGRREQFANQWQHFAFGDLTATAQTRRDVLQRLVPKLKIASRCSFEDKFLVVRGNLRTYKIHLGSGNILMSPNDQYLCIVAARGKAGADSGNTFLPFEGDGTLSLILSKALLLAADDKITDPAITLQLQRNPG